MLNRAHAVASLTIMVLATAASRADMVSFNSPLAIPMVLAGDGRNYSGDATVMLPKFNTMGGTRTLTQVTLQVSGFAAGSAYAENNEAAAGTRAELDSRFCLPAPALARPRATLLLPPPTA